MTAIVATAWLAVTLLLAGLTYIVIWSRHGVRGYAVGALAPSALLAALAVGSALGNPWPLVPPPGQYTVLGAKIDIDKAIYVLLDDGSDVPTYYRLPYTVGKANELQAAMDGEGPAGAKIGGDGGVAFEGEAPVEGDEAKQPETPAYQVGE